MLLQEVLGVVEERFWRVALKPGKPTWFGVGPGALAFDLDATQRSITQETVVARERQESRDAWLRQQYIASDEISTVITLSGPMEVPTFVALMR